MQKAQRLIDKLRGRYYDQSFCRLVRLGERAVPDLESALQWPNPQTRISVMQVLGRIGTGPALVAIERCLRDTDEEVQAAAVVELRDTKSYAKSIRALLQSGSTQLRGSVCRTLGVMGYREALPEIVRLLDDPSRVIRRNALLAIGHLGSVESIDLVKSKMLAEDESERSSALYAFKRLDEDAAKPAVIAALYDPDKRLRMHALDWLGEAPDKGAKAALEYVRENDYHEHAEMAAKIIEEIDAQWATDSGQMGTPAQPSSAEETHLRAYMQLQQTDLRLKELKAAFRRSKTLTSAQLAFLSECLADYDDDIRVRSVMMLSEAKSTEARELLLRCLTDPCPDVRSIAISAFKGIENSNHRRALEALKSDPSDRVRSSAITALARLTYPDGLRELIEHSRDGDWVFRTFAADTLGTFSDPEAIERLHELTYDRYMGVRVSAAWALGDAGGPSSLPYLARLRGNDFYGVDSAAKRAIRKIKLRAQAQV